MKRFKSDVVVYSDDGSSVASFFDLLYNLWDVIVPWLLTHPSHWNYITHDDLCRTFGFCRCCDPRLFCASCSNGMCLSYVNRTCMQACRNYYHLTHHPCKCGTCKAKWFTQYWKCPAVITLEWLPYKDCVFVSMCTCGHCRAEWFQNYWECPAVLAAVHFETEQDLLRLLRWELENVAQ